MNKAVKTRIYPTDEQKVLIEKTFGCCRWMWNAILSERKDVYEQTKETVHPTPAKYKTEHTWLKEVDSLALCNAQQNLEKAYKAFFDGLKGNAPKRGFPKFKSKKASRRSYTTNGQNTKSGPTIRYEDGKLKLPKLGYVKCNMYRDFSDGVIKTVTVSEPIDGEYYASICFEIADAMLPEISISEDFALTKEREGLMKNAFSIIATICFLISIIVSVMTPISAVNDYGTLISLICYSIGAILMFAAIALNLRELKIKKK